MTALTSWSSPNLLLFPFFILPWRTSWSTYKLYRFRFNFLDHNQAVFLSIFMKLIFDSANYAIYFLTKKLKQSFCSNISRGSLSVCDTYCFSSLIWAWRRIGRRISFLSFKDLSNSCIMLLEIGHWFSIVQIDQHVCQVWAKFSLRINYLLLTLVLLIRLLLLLISLLLLVRFLVYRRRWAVLLTLRLSTGLGGLLLLSWLCRLLLSWAWRSLRGLVGRVGLIRCSLRCGLGLLRWAFYYILILWLVNVGVLRNFIFIIFTFLFFFLDFHLLFWMLSASLWILNNSIFNVSVLETIGLLAESIITAFLSVITSAIIFIFITFFLIVHFLIFIVRFSWLLWVFFIFIIASVIFII